MEKIRLRLKTSLLSAFVSFGAVFGFCSALSAQTVPGRIVNGSIRGQSGPLSSTFILGVTFAKGGSGKTMLIRAVGPTLANFGLDPAVVMADPVLTLYAGDQPIVTNDNWETQPGIPDPQYRISIIGAQTASGAFPLATGNKDAAILGTLSGGGYTVLASAKDPNATKAYGLLMFEFYEVNDPVNRLSNPLINVSGRGYAGAGSNTLILGFAIDGATPVKTLIRVVGPGLSAYGVSNVIADPILTVYNGSKQVVASNDDWGSATGVASASSATGAFPLATGSKDSAVIATLQPGSYTVLATGKDGCTGNAIIEVYVIP